MIPREGSNDFCCVHGLKLPISPPQISHIATSIDSDGVGVPHLCPGSPGSFKNWSTEPQVGRDCPTWISDKSVVQGRCRCSCCSSGQEAGGRFSRRVRDDSSSQCCLPYYVVCANTTFTHRLFGFLLGATTAGAGMYYYVIDEYRISNELLTEDIYVRIPAIANFLHATKTGAICELKTMLGYSNT